MASRSNSIESFDEYEFVLLEDLSTWEFIDLSEDDCVDLDNFSLSESSYSSFLVENLADGVISVFEGDEDRDLGSPSSALCVQSLLGELQPPNLENNGVGEYGGDGRDELAKVPSHLHQDVSTVAARDDECENYDEDDEHGYEDEYDDELVPIDVRNRFGKQRIRKLGKRACPKMKKSKKLPYKYNRPGCVHGKHGLGVQYAYI